MVSDGGVPPVRVVEAFDVVEDGGSGLVPVGEAVPGQESGFEGGEERFGYGVELLCQIGGCGGCG